MRTETPRAAALAACLALTFAWLLSTDAVAQDLATPYTAEQIRDAWTEGLEMMTRVTTPEGVALARTTVTEWSEEGATILEQPLDTSGRTAGKPQGGQATWEDLRNHALFPSEIARRERDTRSTPLGELDGWLYLVQKSDGAIAEFFFADAYPGPPVVYGETRDGKRVFLAVVVAYKKPEK